jgi:hypothetical protein
MVVPMFKRLRRLFLALSAFGYAFLGGGPSLWALGLRAEPTACSMAGCHCDAMRLDGVCTCALQRLLAKEARTTGHCQMRSAPLQPEEASDGSHSLPSQQLHTLPGALAELCTSPLRHVLNAAPMRLLFHPEPPTPIPD